jgi:transposase-like protein
MKWSLSFEGDVIGYWRAVDNEGEVLDLLVQSKRNAKAALKLMRKLLKKHGWAGHPRKIRTSQSDDESGNSSDSNRQALRNAS